MPNLVSISSGATYVVSKNGLIDTRYTSIPVSVGWNRQLNPTTTIGASVGAVTTDYDGPARVRSITPRLTLTKQLSARLTVGGSVGVSFSRSMTASSPRIQKASPATSTRAGVERPTISAVISVSARKPRRPSDPRGRSIYRRITRSNWVRTILFSSREASIVIPIQPHLTLSKYFCARRTSGVRRAIPGASVTDCLPVLI